MVEKAKTVSTKQLREMRETVKHTFQSGSLIHKVSEKIFADEMERRGKQAENDRRRQQNAKPSPPEFPVWFTSELSEACRVGGFSDPFEMD